VKEVNIGASVFRAWVSGLQEGASLKVSHDELLHHFMMNYASGKVSEVARTKLSLMGASGQAKPLLQKLQEERADRPPISRTSLSV
jgi:hypothetical protein